MFETQDFRVQIVKRLELAVGEFRLRGFHPSVPDVMFFLGMANEEFLLQHESDRPVAEQRGLREAYISAQNLSMSAARVTRDRQSPIIEVRDLATAYARDFCSFWPFCR